MTIGHRTGRIAQGLAGRGLLGLALCASLVLGGGCAGKLEKALSDHRGTETWNSSSEAFKEIMRRYVHGDEHTYTDAELDEQFEAYLTLDQSDVDAFVLGQSCVPESGTGPAQYYMANSTHQRHDAHYKKDPAWRLTGEGEGQTMRATFSANMLLERHEIDALVQALSDSLTENAA